MRNLAKSFAVLSVLFAVVFLSGCVGGTLMLEKKNGVWEAQEVRIPRNNVTPAEIRQMEDRLNGR